MSHSPQFGYLGLNKTGLTHKEKAIEAGLFLTKNLKSSAKDNRQTISRFAIPTLNTSPIRNMSKRSILEKDRQERGIGGHSSKI